MGLARAVGPAQWLLAEEAESSLRELGIRGDIIRTMQRAFSAQGHERSPTEFAISETPMAPEQTIITSSCGFNHLPRQVAYGKLRAMTEAKRILGG